MTPPRITELLQQGISSLLPLQGNIQSRLLHFKRPARTSRGALTTRQTYTIHLQTTSGAIGIGECCTMPGLSPEDGTHPKDILASTLEAIAKQKQLPPNLPSSFRFGIESALWSLLAKPSGAMANQGVEIHHLIWMDTADAMLLQMEQGIRQGFRCLKMKIGALPFEEECELLREARRRFPLAELRVDANGAFSPQTALEQLTELAHMGVSFIEQPLPPSQLQALATLIQTSPLPIALDESLIGAQTPRERRLLLDTLHPAAIVIKPSLHGGWTGTEDWICAAEERHIEWWLNSALESKIGLSALTRWCQHYAPGRLQGLGTGQLFADDDTLGVFLKKNLLFLSNS